MSLLQHCIGLLQLSQQLLSSTAVGCCMAAQQQHCYSVAAGSRAATAAPQLPNAATAHFSGHGCSSKLNQVDSSMTVPAATWGSSSSSNTAAAAQLVQPQQQQMVMGQQQGQLNLAISISKNLGCGIFSERVQAEHIECI